MIDWHKKWETSDIAFHQATVHPQLLRYFESVPPGKVMAPLCGKSLDLLWLRDRGHEVVGVELSPLACEAFFSENSLPFRKETVGAFTVYRGERISLWCGDFFATSAPAWEGVTALYDRAALIALPSELRARYARHIQLSWDAPAEAQVLLITVEYPAGASIEGPPYAVLQPEVRRLYESTFRVELLQTRRDPVLSGRLPKFTAVDVLESVYRLHARTARSNP